MSQIMHGEADPSGSYVENETIFAVASGVGRASVAILRVSGPAASAGLLGCIGRIPPPRTAVLTDIHHPVTRERLDRGVVLWFPGPKSFTGEDVAEYQVHGGRAVVASILRALASIEGSRLAAPGEFTRRAFLNGRMDLAQVEGLADLIDSETEQQRRQALTHLSGVLGALTGGWRASLVEALALIEAELDFADEGDAPQDVALRVRPLLSDVIAGISKLLDKGDEGEKLREGLTIVIAGKPNVGKSSLLNKIASRDAAIVSAIPGTTRDLVEVQLDVGGYPLRLVDTAGIRRTRNVVELSGIERAGAAAAAADLVLWLYERPADAQAHHGLFGHDRVWEVRTKSDLQLAAPPSEDLQPSAHIISVRSGAGIDGLMRSLERFASDRLGTGFGSEISRERHRIALQQTLAALERAMGTQVAQELELLAEDVRLALRSLGLITGHVNVEEILGEIFSRFCMGK